MSVVSRRQVLAAGGPWALLMLVAGFASRPRGADRRRRASASRNRSASTFCARVPRRWPPDPTSRRRRLRRLLTPSTSMPCRRSSSAPIARCGRHGPGACPVRLFHVDKYNPLGVRINELSNGQARELIYSPDCFDYKDAELADQLPADLGFSGFRVMDGRGKETDWLAFQGASYFRTSGEDNQYGASARGIAVNTALPTGVEEFPRFVEFWLDEPKADTPSITIYALLDGPSITGAYRFDAVKGRGVDHRHQRRSLRPHRYRARRCRAADQHVLVRRERPALRHRLAPGDPRQRRPRHVDRRRRAHLAAAHQLVDCAHQLFRRRGAQGLRPHAARPRLRRVSGRRRLL